MNNLRLVALAVVLFPLKVGVPQSTISPANTNTFSKPTLEATMAFLQAKLADPGDLRREQSWHDTSTGRAFVTKYNNILNNVIADPIKCLVSYRETIIANQDDPQIYDISLSLGTIKEVTMQSYVQYETDFYARHGRPNYVYSYINPPITAIVVRLSDNTFTTFMFTDDALAGRVASALAHAVKLCGGGSKDSFSDDKDLFAIGVADIATPQIQLPSVVDNSQRISQLQSNLGVAESRADAFERSANELANGGNCIGSEAAACQLIGNLGAARQRKEMAKARNEADQAKEEIARLEGQDVEAHARRNTSFSDAFNQVSQEHPTPTINETMAQQQAQANNTAAAIGLRQAVAADQLAQRKAAAALADQQKQEAARQLLLQAAALTSRQAAQTAQANRTPKLQPVAKPPTSTSHAAYSYSGRSFESRTALMAAAKADRNCALHPEDGEIASCDDTIATVQSFSPPARPTQEGPKALGIHRSVAPGGIWVAVSVSPLNPITDDPDISGDGSWGVGTSFDQAIAITTARNNCIARSTRPRTCVDSSVRLGTVDGTLKYYALAINLDAKANDVERPWSYAEAHRPLLDDAKNQALGSCRITNARRCEIVTYGSVGGSR